jgi:hypothetical protein
MRGTFSAETGIFPLFLAQKNFLEKFTDLGCIADIG